MHCGRELLLASRRQFHFAACCSGRAALVQVAPRASFRTQVSRHEMASSCLTLLLARTFDCSTARLEGSTARRDCSSGASGQDGSSRWA